MFALQSPLSDGVVLADGHPMQATATVALAPPDAAVPRAAIASEACHA